MARAGAGAALAGLSLAARAQPAHAVHALDWTDGVHVLLGLGLAVLGAWAWTAALRRKLRAHSRQHEAAMEELRASQMALNASNRLLSATLDAIPDMLVEFDTDRRYLALRAPHGKAFAHAIDAMLGRTMYDVLPQATTAVLDQALNAAERNGTDYGRIARFPRSDDAIWVELSVSCLRGPDGAERLDTGDLDLEGVVARLESLAHARLGDRLARPAAAATRP